MEFQIHNLLLFTFYTATCLCGFCHQVMVGDTAVKQKQPLVDRGGGLTATSWSMCLSWHNVRVVNFQDHLEGCRLRPHWMRGEISLRKGTGATTISVYAPYGSTWGDVAIKLLKAKMLEFECSCIMACCSTIILVIQIKSGQSRLLRVILNVLEQCEGLPVEQQHELGQVGASQGQAWLQHKHLDTRQGVNQ